MSARRLFNVPPSHRAFDALNTVRYLADRSAGHYPLERSNLDAVLKAGEEAVVALRELESGEGGYATELGHALDALAENAGGPECWRDRLDGVVRLVDDLLRRLPAKPQRDSVPMYHLAEVIASVIDEAPAGGARGLVRILQQTLQAAEYKPLESGRRPRRRRS